MRDVDPERKFNFDDNFLSAEEIEAKRIEAIAEKEFIPESLKGRYVPDWMTEDDDEDVAASYRSLNLGL